MQSTNYRLLNQLCMDIYRNNAFHRSFVVIVDMEILRIQLDFQAQDVNIQIFHTISVFFFSSGQLIFCTHVVKNFKQ